MSVKLRYTLEPTGSFWTFFGSHQSRVLRGPRSATGRSEARAMRVPGAQRAVQAQKGPNTMKPIGDLGNHQRDLNPHANAYDEKGHVFGHLLKQIQLH